MNKVRELTIDDLEDARIGKRYWNVSRSSIPDKFGYKKILVNYIEGICDNYAKGTGLMFKGGYGSGKTSAAVIILKAALASGYSAMFLATREVCSAAIEKVMFDRDLTLLGRARKVDFLLVDDLGDEAEKKSDYVPALLEGILRHRSDRRKVTCLTTNLTEVALKERYGQSLMSVMSGCIVPVKIDGFDWRKIECEQNLNDIVTGMKKEG